MRAKCNGYSESVYIDEYERTKSEFVEKLTYRRKVIETLWDEFGTVNAKKVRSGRIVVLDGRSRNCRGS